MRNFSQVDVFTAEPLFGNPVAVVLDGDGLTDEEMAQFANWTNLSETTFVLPPTDPAADYRVRIFTTTSELPFAGHPTIGTCHAWLEAGGVPKTDGRIVQECGVGLVTLRSASNRLAFAAPPLIKGGPASEDEIAAVVAAFGVARRDIVDAQWADNGPGWLAVMMSSSEAVLALTPNFTLSDTGGHGVVGEAALGVVGLNKIGALAPADGVPDHDIREHDIRDHDIEVRAFFRSNGQATEDPVTGSLNAGLAQWLLGNGTLSAPYVARQGTVLGRRGYVHVEQADGEIWIGGDAVTVISGTASLKNL